ncbi:efflux RND transporter periplasmic adaptor subunit [Leptothoe sp. PORK10 BA2]|uniref:efflux RND transporter periplasmic adaptor subunit n=1 Tax=Leptothoe sp. PORK10 BA2 TaxID=3110254 RepID=UPI002B206FC5|nr:efflux RND transporter periplasmic adaptor subunit [Leptothoe sp. PORK10 BA2]MEA5465678.1 efflux RND transporter periplasmic adaptor subunit [Leptothoe sp. PORK10 BA2]
MTYRNFQDDPSIQDDPNGQNALGTSGTSNESSGEIFGERSLNIFGGTPANSAMPKRSGLSGVRGIGLGLLLGIGVSLLGGRLLSRPTAAPTETNAAGADTSTAPGTAASVTVQQIQAATIQQSLKATGTVQAFDLLQVSPQVGGLQIREVRVRQGDQVTAGQVLAVFDDSVLRTQLAQAEANYAQAEAEVVQKQASQAQAEATAAEAQENFDRYQSLYDQGGISEEQLNSRRTHAITAREAVSVAQAEVQSAQAAVNSRRAEINRLETQLGQTLVIAPANGQIAERQAKVGDTPSTGSALFTMIQDGLLELVVDLPQRQLAAVQVGMPVKISSSSNDQISLSGVVRSIDPQVNQQTRQAAVNISLSANGQLRPGMFLQAEFMTSQRTGMVLPANAILPQADDSSRVFTVNDDDQAELVTVTVGARLAATDSQPERLEILSGLDEGMQVIVEGASYLQPGDRVSAVPSPFSQSETKAIPNPAE